MDLPIGRQYQRWKVDAVFLNVRECWNIMLVTTPLKTAEVLEKEFWLSLGIDLEGAG
jgi:hypothetical protein